MAKKVIKNHIKNEIVGVLFIMLGLLIGFSVFLTSYTGIIGSVLQKVFYLFFGIGTFVVPFFTIFIGICYIGNDGRIKLSKKFFGLILFFINTLLAVQIVTLNRFYINRDFWNGIKLLYDATGTAHGGIFAYAVDIVLSKLFGVVGCWIIFIACYIISLILVLKISLYDIFIKIKSFFKFIFKSDDTVKINSEQLPTEEKENKNEAKKEFIDNVNHRIKIIDFMKNSDNIKGDEANQAVSADKESSDENTNQKISEELEKEILQNENNTKKDYIIPSCELLNQNSQLKLNKEDKKELLNNASKLEDTLASFGVEAKVIQVAKGPSVTRFELQPNAGVKVSKIVNLADDIALNLAASGVRIEAPIPGKAAVGIEVPNKELTPVFLREVIESQEFSSTHGNLIFGLGKDIAGNCVVSDLSKMPHVLIAGATGSGKSVCINTLIISILYKYAPEQVKLLMIDPKVVELSVYNGIPHLLIPVVTDPKKAAGALNWAVNEMTRRYKLFADNGVRNIEGYNELFDKGIIEAKLPFIVIVVDELADLMMVCPNDVEDYIGRLAQMARAAGMHLVIATQRPSVDVITGVIKANIPSRISFSVSSQIDSRTILDTAGAEKLLGRGDMLFYPVGEAKPVRIQGAFISEEEVERVVEFIKGQESEVQYHNEILEEIDTKTNENSNDEQQDELFEEAIQYVVETGQASTSALQRKFRIGYNRAARMIEDLENMGIISEKDGSKPRQVLIDKNTYDSSNYFHGNN